MANYTSPATIKPISDRLVANALEAINAAVPAQGVAVEDATVLATAVTQLNALLASLRTAGVIASE